MAHAQRSSLYRELIVCCLISFKQVLVISVVTATCKSRDMQAIVFAYDVTRRETFESIQDTWLQEVAEHSNVEGAVKMVVANKVDRLELNTGWFGCGTLAQT